MLLRLEIVAHLFSQYEHGGQTFRLEGELANASSAIEHVLRRCAGIAEESDLEAVRWPYAGLLELYRPDWPRPRPG